MKRKFILSLVLALSVSSLAGCSNYKAADKAAVDIIEKLPTDVVEEAAEVIDVIEEAVEESTPETEPEVVEEVTEEETPAAETDEEVTLVEQTVNEDGETVNHFSDGGSAIASDSWQDPSGNTDAVEAALAEIDSWDQYYLLASFRGDYVKDGATIEYYHDSTFEKGAEYSVWFESGWEGTAADPVGEFQTDRHYGWLEGDIFSCLTYNLDSLEVTGEHDGCDEMENYLTLYDGITNLTYYSEDDNYIYYDAEIDIEALPILRSQDWDRETVPLNLWIDKLDGSLAWCGIPFASDTKLIFDDGTEFTNCWYTLSIDPENLILTGYSLPMAVEAELGSQE